LETRRPTDFCPAAACAAAISRLEGIIDLIAQLKAEPRFAQSLTILGKLENISDSLMIAADHARTRLSEVDAVSAAGAAAQLLAAIRDIRVSDDMEMSRARDLEARAARFLSSAGLSDAAVCKRLSQTKLGKRASTSQLARAPAPT
jgi:replicative superfamily II helicase